MSTPSMFPTSLASSSSSSSSSAGDLSPWERMRRAKVAMMADEEEQAGKRREGRRKRRERRESSIQQLGECSRSSSLDSENLAANLYATRPTPTSILRRSTTLSSASESNDSPHSHNSLPLPTSSPSSSIVSGYRSGVYQRPKLQHASSRVRFSEDSLASSALGIAFLPPASLLSSSIEGFKDDISHSFRPLSVSSVYSDQNGYSNYPLRRSSFEDEAFAPQTLSYPRLASRASNLSVASDIDSSSLSPSHQSIALRESVNRPSLEDIPCYSPAFSSALSTRDSYGSIASTMFSNTRSASTTQSEMARSPFELPTGGAYSALLPSAKIPHNPARVPTINREAWNVDLGLSPRSGPSPIEEQKEVMSDTLQVASCPDDLISSLDMADPLDNVGSVVDEPAYRDVHIDSIDLLPERAEGRRGRGKNQTHLRERSDSTLEATGFPLSPSRDDSAIDVVSDLDITRDAVQDEHGSGTEICLDTPRPEFNCGVFSLQPFDVPSPSSPTISELVEDKFRAELPKSRDTFDTTSSLLDFAVQNGIISPKSHLLQSSPANRSGYRRSRSTSSDSLHSGLSFTKGKGWSGSESEEEGFTQAIRSIGLRKLNRTRAPRKRTSPDDPYRSYYPPLSLVMQPSARAPRPVDRLSQLSSGSSGLSSASSAGPLTPSIPGDAIMPQAERRASSSSSASSAPGNYPWGRSSAPSSPNGSIRSGSSGSSGNLQKSFYEELGNTISAVERKSQRKGMPIPTRQVEGWGKPEVLIDEKWDDLERGGWSESEDEEELDELVFSEMFR